MLIVVFAAGQPIEPDDDELVRIRLSGHKAGGSSHYFVEHGATRH